MVNMIEKELRFGIKKTKSSYISGFALGIIHYDGLDNAPETYLLIQFGYWQICIGKLVLNVKGGKDYE